MKRISPHLAFTLLVFSASLARGQGAFDLAMGFGTAQDKSNRAGIENISSITPFVSCTPSPTDPTCQRTPSLGRLFMGFAGDGMLNKHIGIGGDLTFQPSKGAYGPLQYRQSFYGFNVIYAPVNNKRAQLRFEGGIGGARTSFAFPLTSCVGIAVCQTRTVPIGHSNHFQAHAGAGVQIYLTQHYFIRPQFDFRQVTGFTNQFRRDQVLGGIIWLGYNFGEM